MEVKSYLSNCILEIEKISLHIDGLNIDIVQDREFSLFKKKEYKNKYIIATTLIFHNVEEKDIKKIEEIEENISYLLSFITLSPVRFYKRVINNYESPGKHINGYFNHFRPIIDLTNKEVIKQFVETSYENFKKFKEGRQLKVVIEYLISSETLKMPHELKLATMFILFENLKKTFADQEAFPHIKGFYRYKTNEKKTISFEKLLEKMFDEVKIYKDLTIICKLRNDIIHSGLSQSTFEEQFKIYENCHDLIHLYLLKLLGYKGKYLVFSKRAMNENEAS